VYIICILSIDRPNNEISICLFYSDSHGSWTVRYCTNKKPDTPASSELLQPPPTGVLSWSNSVHDKPLQKVVVGRQTFSDIINGASVQEREPLKQKLFNLLSDQTRFVLKYVITSVI